MDSESVAEKEGVDVRPAPRQPVAAAKSQLRRVDSGALGPKVRTPLGDQVNLMATGCSAALLSKDGATGRAWLLRPRNSVADSAMTSNRFSNTSSSSHRSPCLMYQTKPLRGCSATASAKSGGEISAFEPHFPPPGNIAASDDGTPRAACTRAHAARAANTIAPLATSASFRSIN